MFKSENLNKSQYKKYFFVYLFFLGLFTLPVFFNFMILKNAEEYVPIEEIYKRQSNDKTIVYGSAILNLYKELKLYTLAQRKPQIITIGSSRVLEFRQAFFSKNFYNMGSMVASISEAINVSDFIFHNSDPDVAIIGVDFWWFNEKIQTPTYYDLKATTEFKFSTPKNIYEPAHLILPFQWLKDKKITLEQYKDLLLSKTGENIGLTGKLRKSGFSEDGSYYYTFVITSTNSQDKHFNLELNMIKNSQSFFESCPKVSELHYNKFIELIERYKKHNIKTVLFLPPLATPVNQEMRNHNFHCINMLKDKLAQDKVKIYDFTEAGKLLETSKCEFIDGFHGGDVLYAKILKYLSSKETILKPYVNEDYLNNVSNQFNGLAMIPNPDITIEKETDFLDEQCKKDSYKRPTG